MRSTTLLTAAVWPRARNHSTPLAGGDSSPAWLFLALPLILLTPFVIFLRHHHYELLRSESLLAALLLCGLGAACAALARLRPQTLPHAFVALYLTIFLDISIGEDQQLGLLGLLSADQPFIDGFQNTLFPLTFLAILLVTFTVKAHLSFITTVVFGVMLASTLLFSQSLEIPKRGTPEGTAPVAAADLPPVVHIILDEQMGIEGLPRDLAGGTSLQDDLKDFYRSRGFTLFGQAFSHYYMTTDSLPNLLNGTAGDQRYAHIVGVGGSHRLLQNAWFDRLSVQGYRIKVLQTNHLEYCATDTVRPEDCLTYPANTIHGLMALDLGAGAKVRLLFENFLQGTFMTRVATGLETRLRPELAGEGVSVNAALWHWHPRWLGSLTAMQMFGRLKAELGNLQPGTAYFAHLLLPHHALIYDRNCEPAPNLENWMNNYDAGLQLTLQRNNDTMRAVRYERYFEQVRCVHKKLDELLSVLRAQGQFERATIIVHGDHGSRISRREPTAQSGDDMEDEEYWDNFSVLFAVKQPDWRADYRPERRSIQALFAEHFLGQPLPDEHGQVFLMGQDAALSARPMPAFPP